jgi:hypothetical protein
MNSFASVLLATSPVISIAFLAWAYADYIVERSRADAYNVRYWWPKDSPHLPRMICFVIFGLMLFFAQPFYLLGRHLDWKLPSSTMVFDAGMKIAILAVTVAVIAGIINYPYRKITQFFISQGLLGKTLGIAFLLFVLAAILVWASLIFSMFGK